MIARIGALALLAVSLQAQDRFALEMPDLYPTVELKAGGGVRIPQTPVRRIVIRLRGPAARRIHIEDVDISINQEVMEAIGQSAGDVLQFVLTSKKDLLLPGKNNVAAVVVAVRGNDTGYGNQWDISQQRIPFIVETGPGSKIRLDLTEPRALIGKPKDKVRFVGSAYHTDRLEGLTVNGAAIAVPADVSGTFAFTSEVQFAETQKAVMIEAKSASGTSRLFVPVLAE